MSEILHAAADVSRRIRKLVDEHGAPNTFSPSEVMPSAAMWLGKFLRKPEALQHVNRHLRSTGVEVKLAVSGVTKAAIIDVVQVKPDTATWTVKTLPSGELAVARDGHTVAVMIMGSGKAQEYADAIVAAMNVSR